MSPENKMIMYTSAKKKKKLILLKIVDAVVKPGFAIVVLQK